MLQRIYTILFLLYTVPIFSQEINIKEELAIADKLTNKGQYVEALKHIEAVLAVDELFLDALEKKVNIKFLKDEDKEVLKEIESQIKANPSQPEYHYLRAIVYLYKQKPGKALDDFETAINLGMPEKYMDRLYLNKGVANYNIGNLDLAEVDYQEALEINPKYATVYHSWGMLDYEKGMYDEAVKKFNKALHFGDTRAILYYNLGMSYLRLDDMEQACYHFNKACNLGYKNGCKLYLLECAN